MPIKIATFISMNFLVNAFFSFILRYLFDAMITRSIRDLFLSMLVVEIFICLFVCFTA